MLLRSRHTAKQQCKISEVEVKMAPQLYITVYKEQFSSPGRAKRAQLRPTSAHRRNNPQPRPDFLFPLSLKSNYRSSPHITPRPAPPVDSGRPLFPPVRHLSFHSPVTTCPNNFINTVDKGKPQHMPSIHTSSVPTLPSADKLLKLQQLEPPADSGFQPHTSLKNPARQISGTELRARPQSSNFPAALHHFPRAQPRRTRSNTSLDYSGCCSCFHVVKPSQAGHYVIHPEFVSECLY